MANRRFEIIQSLQTQIWKDGKQNAKTEVCSTCGSIYVCVKCVCFKIQFQIEDYGVEQMAQDVERLQNLNQQAREKCVIEESDKSHMDEKSLYRPFSSEVVAFKVR